ncbi:MAG: family 43 glycosylhydrolase, partial [Pirellulales bacterium]|nr:family 43 glycosylhydrolase [Pirellulales bacterium]
MITKNSIQVLVVGLATALLPVLMLLINCPSVSADTPALDPNWTWVEKPWGRPVIDRGAKGEWDNYAVDNPYVYIENGRFYCFFEAQDKPFQNNGHERFSVAVSDDGLHWRKTGKPLLDVGKGERWDNVVAKLPAGVLKKDGKYYLFYSGSNNRTKQIGLATSTSLTGGWSKSAHNPVIPSRPGHWDSWISTYPSPVFKIGGRYFLLYRGMKRR